MPINIDYSNFMMIFAEIFDYAQCIIAGSLIIAYNNLNKTIIILTKNGINSVSNIFFSIIGSYNNRDRLQFLLL